MSKNVLKMLAEESIWIIK